MTLPSTRDSCRHAASPPTSLAARHLVALGIDSVFLADALPTDEELRYLASLHDDQVVLEADLLTRDLAQKSLLSHTFTARIDEAVEAEREACAKACESEGVTDDERMAGQMFAREIRARNQPAKGSD